MFFLNFSVLCIFLNKYDVDDEETFFRLKNYLPHTSTPLNAKEKLRSTKNVKIKTLQSKINSWKIGNVFIFYMKGSVVSRSGNQFDLAQLSSKNAEHEVQSMFLVIHWYLSQCSYLSEEYNHGWVYMWGPQDVLKCSGGQGFIPDQIWEAYSTGQNPLSQGPVM